MPAVLGIPTYQHIFMVSVAVSWLEAYVVLLHAVAVRRDKVGQ